MAKTTHVDIWRKVGVVVSIVGLTIVVAGVAWAQVSAYTDKAVDAHAAIIGHAGVSERLDRVEGDIVDCMIDVAGIRSTVNGNRDALVRIEGKLDRIKPSG